VIARDVACRPCAHESCPTGHECARSVSVDDVLAQVPALLLLNKPQGAPASTPPPRSEAHLNV
jgi:hypothetical protein